MLGVKKYIKKNENDHEDTTFEDFSEEGLVDEIVDTVISMYRSGYDIDDIKYTITTLID